MKSKWVDDEQDAADAARRRVEKQEKKRAKAEKQQRLEEAQTRKLAGNKDAHEDGDHNRPAKRRRMSSAARDEEEADKPSLLFRIAPPVWNPSRSITAFETLNPIEEGTYGYVSRARDKETGEVVAIKKMKLTHANNRNGLPVTTLREIQTLQRAAAAGAGAEEGNRNIIRLREVVVGGEGGSSEAQLVPDVYLVMDFAAHDLRSLLEDMAEPFLPSEVKTLVRQLASALSFLHRRWIMHRDLKTSNILLTGAATIKIADFGMARFTSDPPPRDLTSLVVTLWYRAPELLLGAKEYDFAIDMWSFGCVFAELLAGEAVLQGRNEVDQLSKIFDLCGVPSDASWPGFRRLPDARTLRIPSKSDPGSEQGRLAERFSQLTKGGHRLLRKLLYLNPDDRPSADEVLDHRYFDEDPRPKREEMFPSFPSKAGLEKRRRRQTPNAPVRGVESKGTDFSSLFTGRPEEHSIVGFTLR